MKINKIYIKNIKSFNDETEIVFNDDFNILIGPNGSGKSNLLDILTICIRNYFLKPYSIEEHQNEQAFFTQITNYNPFGRIDQYLEKFIANFADSEFRIEFIIKKEDIENIQAFVRYVDKIEEQLKNYRNGNQFNHFISGIKKWDLGLISVDEHITYCIKNNKIITDLENKKLKTFYEYLNYFELLLILIRDIENITVHTNYLYFSPYRSANIQNLQANLSTQTYYKALQQVVSATSKSVISLINLSTIYFAEKRRKYEEAAANVGFQKKWEDDEEVRLVSKYLSKLGYGWNLNLIDSSKNIYEIVLKNGEKQFNINQASSGEKEVINFLFGIFAINMNNGVIIIDEPELHLHPRWQNVLLELFNELSQHTKNQFFLSTHAPTFINDKTYNHIIRLHKNNNNVSKVVVLKDRDNIKLRDILHIVNSTNNEKIFFADVVILVEGITDRLVFQKILSEKILSNNTTKTFEIIEIKGKNNISSFREFLAALQVPSFFICDLDYINEIGTPEIKSLFETDHKKIQKDVIKNPKSRDGRELVVAIKNAIDNKDFQCLIEIYDYVKSFRRKLKDSLTDDEQKSLKNFVIQQKEKNDYLLLRGDIEDYFPIGYKSKDLVKVIALLTDENFQNWKRCKEYSELEEIIDEIVDKSSLNDSIKSESKSKIIIKS